MKIVFWGRFLMLAVIVALIAGCSAAGQPEQITIAGETPQITLATPSGQSSTPAAYPVQNSELPDPYPSQAGELPSGSAYPGPDAYPEPYVNPEFALEPYGFKTSKPGTATIHGVLVLTEPRLMLPDPNDGIFLVEIPESESVVSIPPFVVGEVPQADVDERTGEFVFTNIEPGQYAIVVLTTSSMQAPARYLEGGSVAFVTVTEEDLDQTMELDYLQIP